MLTAKEIAQLTPKDRTDHFDRLAALVFSTQAEVATALDIALRTLQNWRKDQTVPVMAILALQSIAEAPNQPSALLQDARQIAAQLEVTAEAIAASAKLMASVVRRLPDPS